MTSSPKKALRSHRSRMKQRGLVRLEVNVRKEDAPLVRDVATALNDPGREDAARALLRERFGGAAKGFKNFLSRAPIEDLDLERPRGVARDVEL